MIKPLQPSMPSMKETFRKRVGNYYLGRTLGEVCCLPSRCLLPPQCDASLQLQHYQAIQRHQSEGQLSRIVQGTYAKVKYGQHVRTGEVVAVKVRHRDIVSVARTCGTAMASSTSPHFGP